MKTLEEVQNQVNSYQKERVVMNAQQFDHLLKRVNIEEDTVIKQRILTVIEKYLDVISSSDVVVPDVEQPSIQAEVVVEDVVMPTAEEVVPVKEEVLPAVEMKSEPSHEARLEVRLNEEESDPAHEARLREEEYEMNQDNAVIDFEKVHELEKALADKAAAESTQEEFSLEETVLEGTPVEEPANVPVEPVVEAPVEEAPAVEEVGVEAVQEAEPTTEAVVVAEEPIDPTQYIEEFGLVSTTKAHHMDQIIERGGVIFRDKRSFMLMLSLEDEIVAIAKTVKLEQFPDQVQKHLKDNGFVSCEVVSFGEITKRSRARYTDVTYRNLQMLEKDHWIVQNVTNLLEKGEVPEHAKKAEVEAKEEVKAAPAEPVTPPVQAEDEETMYFMSTFMIHPSFVGTFQNQKEAILAQMYGISSANGTARLFTMNAAGTVVIGIDEKTPLRENNYSAKIIDYTMKEQDGKTFVQFKLDANVIEETVQPAPVSEEAPASKPNVEVVAKGEVPADFPGANNVSLALFPMAEAMFSLEAAKAMVGQVVHLGMFTRPSENLKRISLMYDVFEMASSTNLLTKDSVRNSKWLARITNVDLHADSVSNRKLLILEFDRLEEVDVFPYEAAEDVREVTEFLPISEETYNQRQQVLASRQAPVQQKEEAPSSPVVPVEQVAPQTASAEQMLNKEYNPEEAKQLINPTAGADYNKGYQELVQSQSKDMGGAIQEIRSQTAVTPTARQEIAQQASGVITNVISQTLKETNIHAKTEQKQTTQVMGNLQDGAGNLTQTQTVIHFATGYSPQSWQKSVGKRIDLKSELQLGNGPVTNKLVSMIGKNGAVVAQAQVPMTEALLLDGNQHSATVLGIEHAVQEQQGFIVSIRLGEFAKVA